MERERVLLFVLLFVLDSSYRLNDAYNDNEWNSFGVFVFGLFDGFLDVWV